MTHRDSLRAFLKEELSPRPGRTASVARMVTACVITMLAVLTFKIPNGFLAVFYVLAISRDPSQVAVRNGMMLLLGNMAGLGAALPGIVIFLDHPLLHFIFVIGTFFLAFFLSRTMTNNSVAFGFSIILVAASSVNIIWAQPNPLRPDVGITLWTSFGMILGSLAAVLTDWLFASFPSMLRTVPPEPSRMFVDDAFSNPAYRLFALKGCLAATICYVTWSGVAWPGLGVCTVTCVIAAPLSTPGSSRRRLTTRLLGLITGGVLCGMGSQVFILPRVDSIVGFALPFAVVSAIAGWISTSGPALAYFGRQMALAYYLTIFQSWGVAMSLSVSRDRLMGILLGLLSMWLVFDFPEPSRSVPLGQNVMIGTGN